MRTFLYLAVVAGCVADEPALELDFSPDGTSSNGTSLNGTSLNGTSLNGTSLNGTSLNGTSLNGTSLNGTSITAASAGGPPLSGSAVVGSSWTGTASNGAPVALRIDAAAQGTGANVDVWFYAVSFNTGSAWAPLCGIDDLGMPVEAVPVAGVWGVSGGYMPSSTQFTFACRARTIAKCVELGYKTYRGFANQLASCVRMMRADYCGTGVAYTVDGTLVNVYDSVGLQADTQAWDIEAEWSPTGARCITSAGYSRFSQEGRTPPSCLSTLQSSTCGRFRTGTYLINELVPKDVNTTTSGGALRTKTR
jgi:hypothetical protein